MSYKSNRDDHGLTERERDIVRLVAVGRTNHEIAAMLYVSPSTVRFHLRSAYRLLRVHNRTEVAAYAWRSGMVA